MSNRPVYRYPPRSHVYNCPCDRCVQCRSQRTAGSDLISFDLGCLGVLLACAAVSALIGALAKLTADTWWTLAAGCGGLLAIGIMYRVVSTRKVRPPKGRLKVEATPQPPLPPLPVAPQPPACPHLNAVMVLSLTEDEILAWLCPQCDASLPEDFGKLRRPCCGTPHGLWHLGNCPHYREWRDITAQWAP